ncbi:S-layer homology domain-containing protein [Alteribacillus sp. JSM 102045]|uniref:S-layer homology domain-containing protein n=1 Tax=Alteribacillus sp. JSM 102045 TaxID=1562101 RepID=UPI0035C24A6E
MNKRKTSNRMLAPVLSIIIALGTGMGNLQTEAAEDFSDVSDDYWASEHIQRLADQHIINGYSDGIYHPGENINRGQTAALLTEVFDLETEEHSESSFDDLNEDSYFTPYAKAVREAGYMNGRNNNTEFAAEMELTREQMASILVRAFEFERIDENESIVNDIESAHESHQNSIETLAQNGITKTEDGAFRPKETVTRAQFAVFLERAMTIKHTNESGIMHVTAIDSNTVDVSFNQELEDPAIKDFSFAPELEVKEATFIEPEDSFDRHAEAESVVRLTTGEQSTGDAYWFYYEGKRTDNIIVGAEG